MHTVEKRSKGLVNFVNAYGQLAKIPDRKIINVRVKNLLLDLENLMRRELGKSA